jgi:hypothetical protein
MMTYLPLHPSSEGSPTTEYFLFIYCLTHIIIIFNIIFYKFGKKKNNECSRHFHLSSLVHKKHF